MRNRTLISILTPLVLFATERAWAGLEFEFTEPVPLSGVSADVVSSVFCNLPKRDAADGNFIEAPNVVMIDGQPLEIADLCAVPGVAAPANSSQNLFDMADNEKGFCWEGFLQLDCLVLEVENKIERGPLFADIRDKQGTEEGPIVFSGAPLTPFVGVVQSKDFERDNEQFTFLPPVAYDIANLDQDGLVVANFNNLFIYNEKKDLAYPFESPLILFHKDAAGIKLSGYLSTPALLIQSLGGVPLSQGSLATVRYPLTVSTGNFFDPDNGVGAGKADIFVASSESLPRLFAQKWREAMQSAGVGDLPADNDHVSLCAIYMRKTNDWLEPMEMFGTPKYVCTVGMRAYDSAVGEEEYFGNPGVSHSVIFVPSSEQAADGKFYVYKFLEEGKEPVDHNLSGFFPQLLPARAIAVEAPQAGCGPYKISTADVNRDKMADFAITYKCIEQLVDPAHNWWKAGFAPYYSVFLSRAEQGAVAYTQTNYQVPCVAASADCQGPVDMNAELTGISFGSRLSGGTAQTRQQFLVVTNNKRQRSEGNVYCTYDYLRSADGVIGIEVEPMKASANCGTSAAAGGTDVSIDRSGAVATLSGEPLVLAKEACSGTPGKFTSTLRQLWEPDFCKCSPNTDDADFDGVGKACDNCNDLYNPFQTNNDTDQLGDPCDNCKEVNNPNQSDVDEDRMGDLCDICPQIYNPLQRKVGIDNFLLDVDGDVGQQNWENIDRCDACIQIPIRDWCINPNNAPLWWRNNAILWGSSCSGASGSYWGGDPWHLWEDAKLCSGTGYDFDGDGLLNMADNCPHINNIDQLDDDEDGVGDLCDIDPRRPFLDNDGDGVPDRLDNCPMHSNNFQADGDLDGWGTLCDPEDNNNQVPKNGGANRDTDRDGDIDTQDNCPFHSNANQADDDGDGRGDVCDRIDNNPNVARYSQPPDTIYDPQADYIAPRAFLRPVNADPLIDPDTFAEWYEQWKKNLVGANPAAPKDPNTYLGSSGRELNISFAKDKKEDVVPLRATQACMKVISGNEALLEEDKSRIRELNKKLHETCRGSGNLCETCDLFVGEHGGQYRVYGVVVGGAAPRETLDASAAVNVFPSESGVTGNVGKMALFQLSGLVPDNPYLAEKRQLFKDVVQQAKPMRIFPTASGLAMSTKTATLSASAFPSISDVLPNVPNISVNDFAAKDFQFAANQIAINGMLKAQLLPIRDFGNILETSIPFAIPDTMKGLQGNIIILDKITGADAAHLQVPIEERQVDPEACLASIDAAKTAGKLTPQASLTRACGWDTTGTLREEYLIAQKLVAKESVSGRTTDNNTSSIYFEAAVVPVGKSYGGGGGFSCFQTILPFDFELSFLGLILVFLPIPVLGFVRLRRFAPRRIHR